ncbi:hypothetical protein [Pseudomonas aeruginosa]|uniref:hypothetical protein n=1 Tax=Pseudomonas aeruginosa TaxID=287 RepID=UPI001922B1D0|nr:hypothetical protein [Pseudomonas aeruginosa]MCT5308654.1 hypothetical protein [Pseudomonas aeruginosa]HBO1317474.1 hypothetical protein [Pseudomonas aeruginosa]
MPDMREEFEAWWNLPAQSELRKSCARGWAEVIWQASRAALRVEDEIDRLKAENEELRGALQAVEAEVDGNLRPLTRDLVNMVSGLKNGSHPNDIYEHCDEIERIIGAALEGDKP